MRELRARGELRRPAASAVHPRGAALQQLALPTVFGWGDFGGEQPRSPRVYGGLASQPERSPEVIATKTTPEGGVGGCTRPTSP
jgi:hypothetical protein